MLAGRCSVKQATADGHTGNRSEQRERQGAGRRRGAMRPTLLIAVIVALLALSAGGSAVGAGTGRDSAVHGVAASGPWHWGTDYADYARSCLTVVAPLCEP